MAFTMYIGVLYLFYVLISWAFASTLSRFPLLFFSIHYIWIRPLHSLSVSPFVPFMYFFWTTYKTIFLIKSLFSLSLSSSCYSFVRFVSSEKKWINLIKMKMTKRNLNGKNELKRRDVGGEPSSYTKWTNINNPQKIIIIKQLYLILMWCKLSRTIIELLISNNDKRVSEASIN